MIKATRLDDFHQPSDIPERFSAFAARQTAARYDLEHTASSYVYAANTWAGTQAPSGIYETDNGLVSVRYFSEADGDFPTVDLRLLGETPVSSTRLYTRYMLRARQKGVLLAEAVNGLVNYSNEDGVEIVSQPEDDPQALAVALGSVAFSRGLVEIDRGYLKQRIYGVVGEEEFDALGQLLIGRRI